MSAMRLLSLTVVTLQINERYEIAKSDSCYFADK